MIIARSNYYPIQILRLGIQDASRALGDDDRGRRSKSGGGGSRAHLRMNTESLATILRRQVGYAYNWSKFWSLGSLQFLLLGYLALGLSRMEPSE